MRQIKSNLKKIFPSIKYIEGDVYLLENDTIYLTKNYYIDCHQIGDYALMQRTGVIHKFVFMHKELQKVIDRAIIEAFKEYNFSIN